MQENDISQNYEGNNNSLNKTSSLDYFQILSSILVTIAKGQQIVQCIRQVITQDNTFTPMSLFKYISKSERYIRCHNILEFLDESNLLANEKQTQFYLTRIFKRYGSNKDNIQYSGFINFIYPWNTGVLREISSNKFKNYSNLDRLQRNVRPSDTVLTAFLALIQQQILVEKKIQAQLADSRFPDTVKLRKVIKSIKKASHRLCTSVIEKSNDHISMLQLRNFIKAFLDVPEYLFIYLGRRLCMNKSGLVSLQILQSTLKRPKRKQIIKYEENNYKQQIERQFSLDQQNSLSNKKYQKEQNYRQQLYKQLAQTIDLNPTRKTPRKKNKEFKNQNIKPLSQHNRSRAVTPIKSGVKKQKIIRVLDEQMNQNNTPFELLSHSQKIKQRQKFKKIVSFGQNSPIKPVKQTNKKSVSKDLNRIFKQYIQIFFKGYKQLDKCKSRLITGKKVDFLALFKSIDQGSGAINSSDIRNLYVRLSGIPTDYDFQLIIQRFSQHGQQWLSYTQFTQIFKGENNSMQGGSSIIDQQTKDSLKHSVDLTPESMRILAQILYLTLDLEYCLAAVVQRLNEDQIKWIFNEICCNSSFSDREFINYQELKKYITQVLQIPANMADTMALLKRLDRSKNGVVLKQEFLTH